MSQHYAICLSHDTTKSYVFFSIFHFYHCLQNWFINYINVLRDKKKLWLINDYVVNFRFAQSSIHIRSSFYFQHFLSEY